MMRSALAVGLALVGAEAGAQTVAPPACAPKLVRWTEDCSDLAGRTLEGVERLRYLPFSADGSAWLTVGGELRARIERFDALDFGIGGAPDYTAIATRALLHADLRTRAGPRAFVQFSAAAQDGREPGPRSFDESEPDLAQGFVDLPLAVGSAALSLRLGRQEVNLDNRLVALRDGVTLRRAFDGAKLDVTAGGAVATAFYLSPVLNRRGAFDDRSTPGETFRGLRLELPHNEGAGVWSLYAFDRKRRSASYAQARGPEHRQTYGARYARSDKRSDFAAQVAVQAGRVAGLDVAAWGMAIDAGWHPDQATRLGIELSVASGDGDLDDGTVATFDPLYPNLGAFTDAPLYYYANQINAQVNAQRRVGAVTLRTDFTLTGRYSTDDAIYTSPGRPLANPAGSERLSAALIEASARWAVRPGLEIYASVLRAEALPAVRDAGGEDATFAMLQITTVF